MRTYDGTNPNVFSPLAHEHVYEHTVDGSMTNHEGDARHTRKAKRPGPGYGRSTKCGMDVYDDDDDGGGGMRVTTTTRSPSG